MAAAAPSSATGHRSVIECAFDNYDATGLPSQPFPLGYAPPAGGAREGVRLACDALGYAPVATATFCDLTVNWACRVPTDDLFPGIPFPEAREYLIALSWWSSDTCKAESIAMKLGMVLPPELPRTSRNGWQMLTALLRSRASPNALEPYLPILWYVTKAVEVGCTCARAKATESVVLYRCASSRRLKRKLAVQRSVKR